MYKRLIIMAFAASLVAAPAPGVAQTTATTTAATDTTKKPKRQPTAGQLAARERQKRCAAEWKQAKADGKIEKGMKWPQYWSACNKRLKAAGA